MSFLRKQESRLVPAQAGIHLIPAQVGGQAIGAFLFLDSRFRGNDTLQPASPQPASPAGGGGELLHSAKFFCHFFDISFLSDYHRSCGQRERRCGGFFFSILPLPHLSNPMEKRNTLAEWRTAMCHCLR